MANCGGAASDCIDLSTSSPEKFLKIKDHEKIREKARGGGKNMRRQFYSQLEPLTLQYFCTYLMVVELFTTTFVTVRF